jgi:hypothetical protein
VRDAPAEASSPTEVARPAGRPATKAARTKDDDHLILDELSERLATLPILREDDPEARGRLLEEIGVRRKAEADIATPSSCSSWRGS